MFDLLTGIGGAIITGGATGLLGTAITGILSFFQERQRHGQEVELRRLDIELNKAEAASAEKIAAMEAESAESRSGAAALALSYEEAARRWSRTGDSWLMQIVDAIRGLTRPALTWVLVALVGVIYFTVGADDSTDDIQARVIDTILYLATTSVLWWFGARQIAKGQRPPGAG